MCKDNKKTVNGTQGVAKIRFFTSRHEAQRGNLLWDSHSVKVIALLKMLCRGKIIHKKMQHCGCYFKKYVLNLRMILA